MEREPVEAVGYWLALEERRQALRERADGSR
jgi:hypothetical protein